MPNEKNILPTYMSPQPSNDFDEFSHKHRKPHHPHRPPHPIHQGIMFVGATVAAFSFFTLGRLYQDPLALVPADYRFDDRFLASHYKFEHDHDHGRHQLLEHELHHEGNHGNEGNDHYNRSPSPPRHRGERPKDHGGPRERKGHRPSPADGQDQEEREGRPKHRGDRHHRIAQNENEDGEIQDGDSLDNKHFDELDQDADQEDRNIITVAIESLDGLELESNDNLKAAANIL